MDDSIEKLDFSIVCDWGKNTPVACGAPAAAGFLWSCRCTTLVCLRHSLNLTTGPLVLRCIAHNTFIRLLGRITLQEE